MREHYVFQGAVGKTRCFLVVQRNRCTYSFVEVKWEKNSRIVKCLELQFSNFQIWLQTGQGWKMSSKQNFHNSLAAWIPHVRYQVHTAIPWATAKLVISSKS